MECNSWVEEGILFTSGELPDDRQRALQEHLSSCKACKDELDTYSAEKSNRFTVDILGESTSRELDARIKDACSKLPRPATVLNPVSLLFKKTLFSILFLAVGFGGGVYFTINLQGQDAGAIRMADQKSSPASKTQTARKSANQSTRTAGADESDSATSDEKTEESVQPLKRGNLKSEGVVPVDLKEE